MLKRSQRYKTKSSTASPTLPATHCEFWVWNNPEKTSKTLAVDWWEPELAPDQVPDNLIAYEDNADFFKNCYHRSDNYSVDNSTAQLDYPPCDGATYGGYITHSRTGGVEALKALYSNQLDDLHGDLNPSQEEITSSFIEMCPTAEQISGKFSLTNFLVEFREFKDMFDVIKDGPDSIFRTIASGHLNWSFGIKPFVKDVITLYDRIYNMDAYVINWNNDADNGEIYTRHFSAPVFETRSSSPITYNTWAVGKQHGVSSHFHRKQVIYHMYFKPKRIRWEFDKHIMRAKALGLHRPLDAIWNAIPFSFVVDWFTNIGDLIYKMERDTDFLGFELVDFCYSVKSEINLGYTYVHEEKDQNSPGGWIEIYRQDTPQTCTSKRYFRRRIHPPFDAMNTAPEGLEWRVPSLKQWLLGTSLVIANS